VAENHATAAFFSVNYFSAYYLTIFKAALKIAK